MAEPVTSEEPRVAEAVARLLSRQGTLLARSLDDEAAAGAARLGLSWLADLLRSFGLMGASDWFQALRVRADVLGGDRTTAAWAALAAPLCEVLAAELRRAGSLAPLSDGAHDWRARVAELTAFAEPPPRLVIVPPVVAAPATLPPPVIAAVPATLPPPVAAAPAVPPAPPTPPAPDPAAAQMPLFEAIADLAGEAMPAVDAQHGRIEIAGEQAGRGGADRRAALAALDQAARAAGAVLVAFDSEAGLRWMVRLPLSSGAHYLFVERGGEALALPWSRVVEYGLAPGGEHARVELGDGLQRAELAVDWLVGQGPGMALPDEPALASGGIAPPGFVLRGRVADTEGRLARVLDVARAAAPPPPAEAVQPVAVPADNHPETVPPAAAGLRALVADDSMMARVFLSRLLAQRGFAVDEAEDGAAARAALQRAHYDIAFLDAEMPGAGAIEILHDVGALLEGRACVLVKDEEERRRVESFGHVPVLFKPFAEDEVRGAVDALLARLPRTD